MMMAHVRMERRLMVNNGKTRVGSCTGNITNLLRWITFNPSPHSLRTYSLLYMRPDQSNAYPGYLLDVDVCIESINDIFCLIEQDR